MRRFTSYGPVNLRREYGVPRTELVERCVSQLVGDAEEPGHYFTIWAARQTGKTWLMRRAVEEIRARQGDRFQVATLSMQGVALKDEDAEVRSQVLALLARLDTPIPAGALAAAVPALRTSRTLEALAAAREAELLTETDADTLVRGWRWVSRVRNAIARHGG